MTDQQRIESLERKGCKVVLSECGTTYIIQSPGQWGNQTLLIPREKFEVFLQGFAMAFNMMMKRHQQFVTMMQGKDVG